MVCVIVLLCSICRVAMVILMGFCRFGFSGYLQFEWLVGFGLFD
jgi:hypothetical protein